MKITGSYTFDAPQEEVWSLLMDPDAIAKAIPGVDKFVPVGEYEYDATLKLGLGAVSGQYAGHVAITEIQAPTSYHMKIGGKGQRGFVNGDGSINLEPQDGKTIVHYVGDAHLGGQLAGVGQRLIEGAARTLINQGFKSLEAQLAERRAVAPAPTPAPTVAGPTPAPVAEAPAPAPAPRPTPPPAPVAPPAGQGINWPLVAIGGLVVAVLVWWFFLR